MGWAGQGGKRADVAGQGSGGDGAVYQGMLETDGYMAPRQAEVGQGKARQGSAVDRAGQLLTLSTARPAVETRRGAVCVGSLHVFIPNDMDYLFRNLASPTP